MNRLRNRLILIFLAATLAPLGATVWITTSLLERSLRYASTDQLDVVSKSLEQTGREFYQRMRDLLKARAASGAVEPEKYAPADQARWPEPVILEESTGSFASMAVSTT